MGDSLLKIRRQLDSINSLGSVVRTMKALAASNISQYEDAVQSLQHYTSSVELGLAAYLRRGVGAAQLFEHNNLRAEQPVLLLVIGSDQGMVGAFNQKIGSKVVAATAEESRPLHLLSMGERMRDELYTHGLKVQRHFVTPTTVEAITPACIEVLLEYSKLPQPDPALLVGYNQLEAGATYTPRVEQILPLEQAWQQRLNQRTWPTSALPEIWCSDEECLQALVREYMFITLFRACAESLASENSARLAAMQRAEKNIDEQLETLQGVYNRKRQDNIDAELFDVTYSLSEEQF
ncbi:MAG: F0F1 ATP synthase subunit gamma [Desulfuromonadaceae bacterium]|nr:F0F1 ATP synthase subunit gamma [Desulfuromonadaceae bacterium]